MYIFNIILLTTSAFMTLTTQAMDGTSGEKKSLLKYKKRTPDYNNRDDSFEKMVSLFHFDSVCNSNNNNHIFDEINGKFDSEELAKKFIIINTIPLDHTILSNELTTLQKEDNKKYTELVRSTFGKIQSQTSTESELIIRTLESMNSDINSKHETELELMKKNYDKIQRKKNMLFCVGGFGLGITFMTILFTVVALIAHR